MNTTVSCAPRGALVGKFVKAIAIARGDLMSAYAFAAGQGPQWVEVAAAFRKSAVAPQSSDAVDGAELMLPSAIAYDFAEYMRPMSLVRGISGVRKVTFNCRMLSAVRTSAYW